MKLLYCNNCQDVFRLYKTTSTCLCSDSGGHYKTDGLNAIYYGPAVPLGFANPSFVAAIRSQPEWGNGFEFTAFVIPKVCPTMVHIDYSEYIPVADSTYDDEYEYLEEDVAKIKAEKKLGNAFKQTDSDAI